MKCPGCGARNAEAAAWCSQCYAPFGTDDHTDHREQAPVAAPSPSAEVVPRARPATLVAGDARFRRSEEGVDWCCVACDAWNPLERSTCAVCGTSLSAALQEDEPPDPERVSLAAIVVASVLLPGSGHFLLGRQAAGIGRLILYVVWAAGGLALLSAAAGADGSVLPALPLLTGAFVLLATSVLDAMALRRGDVTTEILSVRALLWLTVGVIGLTTLAFIASALSVSG